MPFTRSTRSTRNTSAQTSTTPAASGTFTVSGQGLENTSSSLSSLPVLRQPYYSISLTNDNCMFYSPDAPASNCYEDVLVEYNRLIATGVDKVFQISIVSSHVKTTYGGVVVETAPVSTSGFVSASQTDSSEISLVGYTFSRYGKGYLMRPVEDSVYLGNKYFLGGWWNESAGGWFFRKDCVRTLYELGAVFDGPKRYDPTRQFWNTPEIKEEGVDLSGRFYRNYGRGLILFPESMTDPLYGQKYLLDGWWMNTRDGPGWFFRSQFEDSLVAHGARRTNLFTGESLPSYNSYTKTCNTHVKFADDEDFEDDDASDPDYSPNHAEEHEYIEEEYIEDPVASDVGPEDSDELDSDLTDMIFVRYGKGYVLKPHRVDPRYGEGYFLGGFWNKKAKGWFFKREMKKFLKAQGATYLKMRV